MADAQSLATEISSREPSLASPPARRGFFAALLEALHDSRRVQAMLAIRQRRHLIDKAAYRYESNARSGADHHAGK